MTWAVRLDRVTRRHRTAGRSVVALDGVTLDLAGGSLVAVVGPSGSGKSTLLHVLAGWDRIDDGRVLGAGGSGGWEDCAVVPQDLGLLPELTVAEHVDLAAALSGSRRIPTADLLAALGLDELAARLPTELSLGQQQRVAVARATVGRPRLVVADEPTAHQDELNARAVVTVLAALAAAGSTVVVATHDERLVDTFDVVVRLSDGRLVSR